MEKVKQTTSGRNIYIYDNLFSYAERTRFYEFVQESLFKPVGRDNNLIELRGDFNLYSEYTENDLNNLGIFKTEGAKQFLHHVENMQIQQIRVNLSTLNDKNRFHCDATVNTKTILYYPNMMWDLEWGGYTLFANDEMNDIEICSPYISGRVIVMDGQIPHCISAPTNLAPMYRFSLAIQYIEK